MSARNFPAVFATMKVAPAMLQQENYPFETAPLFFYTGFQK